jgi:gamma-glutamyltranspeptidase/glutathione hydrolase
MLADVYDYDLSLGEAQKQMRFHHQLLPENVIFDEPYAPFPAELKAAVETRGYKVERGFVGDLEAIQVIDGAPVPEADPRARGVGVVVK